MSAVTTSRPVARASSATKDRETPRRRTGPDADCKRSATTSGSSIATPSRRDVSAKGTARTWRHPRGSSFDQLQRVPVIDFETVAHAPDNELRAVLGSNPSRVRTAPLKAFFVREDPMRFHVHDHHVMPADIKALSVRREGKMDDVQLRSNLEAGQAAARSIEMHDPERVAPR